MTVLKRLHSHYDLKYSQVSASTVLPSAPAKNPRDRIQMSVYLARKFSGQRYLEIGVGNGSSLLALLDCYQELVGTELSKPRISLLQNVFAARPSVRILEHNLENEELPFPADYFDTIALTDVIEHLFDPIGALQELHRVLRPNGVLLLHTPNIAKWTRRLKLAAGYFPSTASLDEGLLCYDRKTATDLHDEGHLHYFTFRSLKNLGIQRAGFRRADSFGYGRTILPRMWPTLFSEISIALHK
ncbi:MAG: class I SAM-dependent methyltransferase [Acidobacteriaceae bacterium]